MNRLEELLLLWQDGSIAEPEVAELKQLLAEPAARARLAEDFLMTGVLLEALRTQQAAGPRERTPIRADWRRALAWGAAAAAAILLAVLLASPGRRSSPTPFATLELVQGETFVVGNDTSVPARAGQHLVPGAGVRTQGHDSEAIVHLEDDVRLKLSGDTTVFTSLPHADRDQLGTHLAFERGDLLVEAPTLRRRRLTVQTPMGMAIAGSDDTAMQFCDASGVIVVRGTIDFVHKTSGKKVRIQSGQYLAATADGDVYAAQLFSGETNTWTTFPGQGLGVTSIPYALAFSPAEDRLAVVARGGAGAGLRLGAIDDQPSEVRGSGCVAFSPDGKLVAASDVGNILIHDAASGTLVKVLASPLRRLRTSCLAFAPDGKTLAAGRGGQHEGGQIERWDVASGKLLSSVRGHPVGVTCLAYAPDGKYLASGSYDKSVVFVDPQTGAERNRILMVPAHAVWGLAFSPDSKTLAIATGPVDFRTRAPGVIKLWDLEADEPRAALHGHAHAATSVVFAPDGHTLISGGADTTVRLWDLDTRRQYGMLKGHKAAIGFEAIALALSPDGNWLATASYDHTIKLWKTTWLRKKQGLSRPQIGFLSHRPATPFPA